MRGWIGYVVLLVSTGCIENGFFQKDGRVGDSDTDTDTGLDGETDLPDPQDEICNGIDDDGDGEVDEGFSDVDNDGIKDCVDDHCEIVTEVASDLALTEDCGGSETIVDPWDIVIESQWTAPAGEAPDSYISPLVANLTDTDGDGDIDTDDTPNIIMIGYQHPNLYDGVLRVLEGDTGDVVWEVTGVFAVTTPAVADVTGDGVPDIAMHDSSGCLFLLSADGDTLWTTTDCNDSVLSTVAIADLYGDGQPEVVTQTGIFDGLTGAQLVSFPKNYGVGKIDPVIGDIDLDGEQEIVLGNQVYGPDGTPEWSTSQHGLRAHWSVILNADVDAEAEVAMITNGELTVYEHTGAIKFSATIDNETPSAPCMADFDGDGQVELAFASKHVFLMLELDGTEIWRKVIDDDSGASGCAGYDVDGDGAYEIAYADEADFYLLDGKTGATLYLMSEHSSTTAYEYPVIADVDGDGAAEILFVSNYWSTGTRAQGLTILGHNGDGWAKSGPSWSVPDFAVTNINQDSTVPSTIPLYWQDHNVYRARPTVDDFGVDLGVVINDVCFSGCLMDSMMNLSVQVGNRGGNDVRAGTKMTLYSVSGDTLTAIETRTVGAVASGRLLASEVFELTVSDWGVDGLMVRIDDDGTGVGSLKECDEDNNQEVWVDSVCG